MAKITEKDIINAIVALDVEKLKSTKDLLTENYKALKTMCSNKNTILKALEEADFKNCEEYTQTTNDVDKLYAEMEELFYIIDKCNKALKSFEGR